MIRVFFTDLCSLRINFGCDRLKFRKEFVYTVDTWLLPAPCFINLWDIFKLLVEKFFTPYSLVKFTVNFIFIKRLCSVHILEFLKQIVYIMNSVGTSARERKYKTLTCTLKFKVMSHQFLKIKICEIHGCLYAPTHQAKGWPTWYFGLATMQSQHTKGINYVQRVRTKLYINLKRIYHHTDDLMFLFPSFITINIWCMCNVCARAHQKMKSQKVDKMYLLPFSLDWVPTHLTRKRQSACLARCVFLCER